MLPAGAATTDRAAVEISHEELGASRWLQARMVGNLALDALLGVVPVAGDIADVYFKAHMRNLRLLQRELGEPYLDLEAEPARRR